MREVLIIQALEKGFSQRKPQAGLIIHSDREGQYVSTNFRKLLRHWKCRQSMSR